MLAMHLSRAEKDKAQEIADKLLSNDNDEQALELWDRLSEEYPNDWSTANTIWQRAAALYDQAKQP